jgi:hypothetical protein
MVWKVKGKGNMKVNESIGEKDFNIKAVKVINT